MFAVPAFLCFNFELLGCWEAGCFLCAFGENDRQDIVQLVCGRVERECGWSDQYLGKDKCSLKYCIPYLFSCRCVAICSRHPACEVRYRGVVDEESILIKLLEATYCLIFGSWVELSLVEFQKCSCTFRRQLSSLFVAWLDTGWGGNLVEFLSCIRTRSAGWAVVLAV